MSSTIMLIKMISYQVIAECRDKYDYSNSIKSKTQEPISDWGESFQ